MRKSKPLTLEDQIEIGTDVLFFIHSLGIELTEQQEDDISSFIIDSLDDYSIGDVWISDRA